jgi:uncharacterized protein YndB with AHSA1/START domain
MAEVVAARIEREITGLNSAEVFDAWTREDLLRAWMALPLAGSDQPTDIRTLRTDPRAGGRFEFADMRDDGLARAFGTYLVVERPGLLALTWFTSEDEEKNDHSVVRMNLRDIGDGCRVELSHEMSAAYADYLVQTEDAWRLMLTNIETALGRRAERMKPATPPPR